MYQLRPYILEYRKWEPN